MSGAEGIIEAPADLGAELFTDGREPRSVQRQVDGWFSSHADEWQAVYGRCDPWAVIHQRRLALALEWADRLGLAPGARVLDVGCGAGLATAALAGRGLRVAASDSVAAMLQRTRRHVAGASHEGRLDVVLVHGDAHALPWAESTFELVIALGVLPWLHSPGRALAEMARVTRPGGHVIANVDNLWRLTDLLDPRLNPLLRRPRAAARRLLLGPRPGVRDKSHSLAEFRGLLARAGLQPLETACFGFGPFTLFGKHVLPAGLGVRVHHALQARADGGAPLLRSTGAAYMVLAQRAMYPAREVVGL